MIILLQLIIPMSELFKCIPVFPLVRAVNVRGLFGYYCSMFVLTSKHKQRLRKGVTSTNKSTYIRSTYKREC